MRIEVLNKSHVISYYPQIAGLLRAVWPSTDPHRTLEQDIQNLREENEGHYERDILFFDQSELIGYARIYKRDIIADQRRIHNMALSSVCVKGGYQGHGIGKQIVQQAFEFVDTGKFECSLFQTKVPDFYLKLGAGVIGNEVINSKNIHQKPFSDPFIMVYPANFEFGKGQIDLNGYGY